jgi:uncharacterized membrane protein
MHERPHRSTLISAGVLLGIGLGGFIDGIVFHQLLQWHNLLSSVILPVNLPNMQTNMFWDGVFHAFTWVMTAIGLALLWRAGQKPNVPWSTCTFGGSLLLGWGLFNLVEGIINHQILGIHHVNPGANELAWDLGFLLFGALLVAAGSGLIRVGRRDTTPRGVHHAPVVHPRIGMASQPAHNAERGLGA